MNVEYDANKEKEREVESLCGFYQSDPSMLKRSFPRLEDQPVS